ncbi:MAG: hypothetical protein KAX31_06215, partial [Thermoplasmata archaeon]|nr:hypothetical protein [Thermoplasmata archaeon]
PFTATAYDVYNNPIPGVDFVWSTDVGTVDAVGLFTAQTLPGTGTVTATNGSVSGVANVDVVIGDIDHVIVLPDPATVTVGEFQQFTAAAYDVYDNLISDVIFLWSTNVGVINSTGYLYAHTTPAIGWVNATSGAISGSASVDVVVGEVNLIILTPDPLSITVGGSQQFVATAYDVYNNLIPSADFIWTTDAGSVDAAGYFTAKTTPGTGTVTATNGTVSGSAVVDVIVGDLDHIVIVPNSVSVAVGDTLSFTAIGLDEFNNVISGVTFTWTTDVGSIDNTGMFIAQTTPAVGVVTATNGTINGSATVNVVPGPVDRIVINPDNVTITVGDSQSFTATAYDIYDNVVTSAELLWTTDVGTVDGNGQFTAQTSSGTGTVTATNGTVSSSANVDVVIGILDHIIVSPDPATVIVGEQQQFTATAYDVFDNVIPGVTFTWTTDVGSVDPAGLFTAQTTSSLGMVTAANGTVSHSATVTVGPGPIDHIIVTPDPLTVIVNGVQQFNAEAYDVYNNVIPGVNFLWTTDVGTIDASGLFTAQPVPGTGIVTASNGTVSDTATVDVIDVIVDHIVISPDPVTVTVGGTQLFTATAYDQFNNVIPGVDFIWTTDV